MEQKIIQFLQENNIALTNKKIVIAVSGGPDSVALLHILNEWKERFNLRLVAVTVNHQLRADADKDVQYVRHLCQEWNIPLIDERIQVRDYEQEHKVSMQVAARTLRYEVFANVMEAEKADYLAFGHHGDDQIETLIMSLMRSTTLSALTGIPFTRPFASGAIIRPLLAVTRKEIEAYCRMHHLSPRIDPSNEDLTYTRNYVRKLIVPKLKEKNESLHRTIQELSESLHEDEQYLQTIAQSVFEEIVQCDINKRKATIPIAELKEQAIPLQRRIYRLTLDYLYEKLPPQLSHSHEAIFLSLIDENQKNKRLHFPKQLIIELVYNQIEFYFYEKKQPSFSMSIFKVPTRVALPNGHVLKIEYTNDVAHVEKNNEYICAVSQVSFPLKVRTRRPGDRMRYRGLRGSKKVKDILIDEKIPRHKRDGIPIITDANDDILWLVGIRKGALPERANEGELALLLTYET